jgi:ATP-dependent DNA helicase RecQ
LAVDWLRRSTSLTEMRCARFSKSPPQKEMENSYQQARNVIDAFQADPQEISPGPVLLVDDIVDSRWSLTVCAMLLRQAGSGPVYPLALASAARGGSG